MKMVAVAISAVLTWVKIIFVANARPTEKFYYQTQVAVLGGDQISILD